MRPVPSTASAARSSPTWSRASPRATPRPSSWPASATASPSRAPRSISPLGYSHPVVYEAPEGITFEVPDNTHINVKGINKQQVGQVAAEIRAKRPPEPYKGKGILLRRRAHPSQAR